MPTFTHTKTTTRAEFFSLIEWLVVLAVIAMVLGIVLPKIGAVPSTVRIAKSTGSIRSAFQAAQSRALASGQIIQVFFDFPNHCLHLEPKVQLTTDEEQPTDDDDQQKQTDDDAARYSMFDDLKMFELDELTDLNTELVDRPENTRILSYKFYPNGEAAGPVMPIVIDDHWFNIDVDRLTGRPLITEVEADE